MTNVRECRLLVEVEGSARKVCKLVFSSTDASLFLIPYGKNENYLWGAGRFVDGQSQATFANAHEVPSNEKAKLSIHESGQIHIKTVTTNKYKAGPLNATPLWEFRGEHLATVSIDNLLSLAPAGKLRSKPKSPDVVLKVNEAEASRRFVLYANGASQDFVPRPRECIKAVVVMNRAGLPAPLHIGIATFAQAPLDSGEGGITIIAGWKADTAGTLARENVLWVRAR